MNVYTIWLALAMLIVEMSFIGLLYVDRYKEKLFPKVKSLLNMSALLGLEIGFTIALNVIYDLIEQL